MYEILIAKIVPLILAATPISLILINKFSNIFSKHNLKLGDTNAICTNIEGTLTKNTLSIRTIFFDKYKATVEDKKNIVKIKNTENKDEQVLIEKTNLVKDPTLNLIAITASLCHFEKIKKIEDTIQESFTNYGFNKHQIKREYEIIEKLKTNKEKKYSTVIAKKIETKEIFAFSKGNPLKLLKKCTKTFIDGKKTELTPQNRRKIRKSIEILHKNGQKTIGFAYKALPLKRQKEYTEQFAENDMTLTGIIGITNPLKENLEESISLTKQAGIKIYILTKVKERKAIAIGKILKIINPQYFESITGAYLRQLPDQKIEKMLENKEKDYVFAELDEKDKDRIVEILRNQGKTVAVINGKTKNSLKEVVEGIAKGRIHNKNYEKFGKHALSCKIAEIILLITALIIKAPTPLSIALIITLDISINLILELALRADYSEKDVLTKNFDPQKTKLINKKSINQLLTTGISTGIALSAIFIWSLVRFGWTPGDVATEPAIIKSITITFVLLALIQTINITKSHIFKNIYLLPTAIISILLIYAFTTIQIFKDTLNLSTLSTIEWDIVLFLTLIIVIIEEARKFIARKLKKS
jgi:Ca2+-transporting ATPase